MKASLEPDIPQFICFSVGLVSLCIHSLILLMATEGQLQPQVQAGHSNSTFWTEQETDAFVNYLLDKKAEIGDSGMFKSQTFQAAADFIQPLLVQGSPKTPKICKTKYSSVSSIRYQISLQINVNIFIVKIFLSSNTAVAIKIWHEFTMEQRQGSQHFRCSISIGMGEVYWGQSKYITLAFYKYTRC